MCKLSQAVYSTPQPPWFTVSGVSAVARTRRWQEVSMKPFVTLRTFHRGPGVENGCWLLFKDAGWKSRHLNVAVSRRCLGQVRVSMHHSRVWPSPAGGSLGGCEPGRPGSAASPPPDGVWAQENTWDKEEMGGALMLSHRAEPNKTEGCGVGYAQIRCLLRLSVWINLSGFQVQILNTLNPFGWARSRRKPRGWFTKINSCGFFYG